MIDTVKGISPQDVIADGNETAEFQGQMIRKGTVKAAIENVKIMESEEASILEKQAAKDMIKKLAPDIIALELDKYMTWKNPDVQAIFDEMNKS